ncbi:hypothetical protein AB0C89_35105 [Streptomyces sp. NPDC048491]|uniref:hypothetical protein n=1 Tax=Streptomyces sp. NPDC048491 TaxID=3157207 RepID=UPI003434BE84
MAGMRIVVCLPGSMAGTVNEAVAEVMAPFEIGGGRADEFDIWDYYRICGGAEGFGFATRAGFESDPRPLHDQPRFNGTSEPSLPGMCAGGPRGLLDLSANHTESVALAGRAWDLWTELSSRYPAPESLEAFVARSKAEMGVPQYLTFRMEGYPDPWTPAYERYQAQPLCSAYLSALDDLKRTSRSHRYGTSFLDCFDPIQRVGGLTREAFISQHSRYGLGFNNVLTLNGWWYGDGDPGLHSACESRAVCPHTPDIGSGSGADVDRYLLGLPDDALLIYLRLHV